MTDFESVFARNVSGDTVFYEDDSHGVMAGQPYHGRPLHQLHRAGWARGRVPRIRRPGLTTVVTPPHGLLGIAALVRIVIAWLAMPFTGR